jgi:hypothetical protein
MTDKKIGKNEDLIAELEKSKRAVLKRVAENLKSQVDGNAGASHQSHSSNPQGRTHSSSISN